MAQRLIEEYLAIAGHGADATGPMFRPVTNTARASSTARSIPPRFTATSSANTASTPGSAPR